MTNEPDNRIDGIEIRVCNSGGYTVDCYCDTWREGEMSAHSTIDDVTARLMYLLARMKIEREPKPISPNANERPPHIRPAPTFPNDPHHPIWSHPLWPNLPIPGPDTDSRVEVSPESGTPDLRDSPEYQQCVRELQQVQSAVQVLSKEEQKRLSDEVSHITRAPKDPEETDPLPPPALEPYTFFERVRQEQQRLYGQTLPKSQMIPQDYKDAGTQTSPASTPDNDLPECDPDFEEVEGPSLSERARHHHTTLKD